MLQRIYKQGLFAGIFLQTSFLTSVYGQTDSVETRTISDIIITEHYKTTGIKAATPTQILTSKELSALNALQISDAVKHFSGVTVKDYGGIGGLKTVSIRSLGANHTAVGYDGITLSDNQTGQIDLSRFSIDNVDIITLNNGHPDQVFQPARMFASAGVLNLRSKTPVFDENKTWNAEATLKAGSFGLVNPNLSAAKKLNRRWSLALNGEWLSSNGKYPYTQHYGSEQDSISREWRTNTQVQTFRSEAGAFGRFSDSDSWRLKLYYYQSSRGLPGAAIWYNPYSAKHLYDKNFFGQSHYRKIFSRSFDFQVAAKYNRSYQHYHDPVVFEENHYYQQEYYLTTSLLYNVLSNLSFSFSTDGAVNTLQADTYNFPDPRRYSWLSVLAGKYMLGPATFSTSVLATLVKEDVQQGESAGNHQKLSPYAGLSVRLLKQEELYLRSFYKKSFRMPTFNDLYYSRVGNLELKPENADQYNVGIAWSKNMSSWLSHISVTADSYYNRITNKIIAIPVRDIFFWSMFNLGVVEIKGIDATLSSAFDLGGSFGLDVAGNYTFQRALDMSLGSETYKHQIAYTPSSSGSGSMILKTPWVEVAYTLVASGYRYALGQNTLPNRLNGYIDHNLSASRGFKFAKLDTRLSVEILNIGGENYEIVKSYPMPGRSFRITLKVRC